MKTSHASQENPAVLQAKATRSSGGQGAELTGWRMPFAVGRVVTKTWAS